MPNSVAAKKRHRQSLEDRARNRACKSSIRTSLRKIRESVAAGKLEDAQRMLPALAKQFDQSAAKGIIHRNKASRLKSRLAHLVSKAKKA
jgi:small subunit ribosomal protein S20